LFKLIRNAGLAGLLLLVLGACSSLGGSGEESVLPPADPVASAVGRAEYHIGPSDLLEVSVFQVEDLDREVRVNNAGQVSLPLVGAVPVAGLTVDQIEAEVARRYAAQYLQNPQVSVFVKEFASQRVTVGGAVNKPGIYPMTSSRLSLLQALALAEGLDDVASLRNVIVFRTSGGQRQFARFDVAAIQAGEHADPELAGEDIVVVDTSTGKVALQNLIKLAPFVAVWRAYR
jgi:polysaccharide export outer membrane protein